MQINRKKKIIIVVVLTVLLITTAGVIAAIPMYKEIQGMKTPKYEVGDHQGAAFCGTCHQEIYSKWSQNSRHAVATSNENFLSFKGKFTENFMLNKMMGEEMCYACHGSKDVNAGVDCETCHGTASSDTPIMDTHVAKFTPGRENLEKPDFCAKCHEIENVMTPYSDWLESDAAKRDITCQGCHMEPKGSEVRYHGFDTITRNEDIYQGDLAVKDFKLDFPQFSLAVENKIAGHGVPVGGPSRILVLELSFLDSEDEVKYKIIEKFHKKFELLPIIGLMPDSNRLIENTQLQSGEVRKLSYTLPDTLEGKVDKVVYILRFYDVSDEYQGNLEMAHWVSEPIIEKEVKI